MATKSLGSLTVDLLLQTAGFDSGMDKAGRIADAKTRQIERQARERAKAIETAFGDMASTIAGAFTGLQVLSFGKQVVDMQGRLDDLSKSTSLSVTTLAGLDHAARLSGSNLDTVASAVNKLAVNMGKDAEKFAKLGVTAKDPIEAFAQLADILRGIEDPQKRAAVAAEALGKGWQEMAPLLSEGSAGIRALVNEGTQLSGVTEANNKQTADFGDNLEKLRTASYGLANTLMNPLIPTLNDLIDKFNEAAKARNLFGWSITSGKEEDNAAERLGEITAQLYRMRKMRDELSEPTFANKLNDLVFGDVHDLNTQIAALEKKADYLQGIVQRKAKGTPETPPAVAPTAKAVNDFLDDKGSTKKAITDGQRLVEQLQNRLFAAQKLTEAERLEAEIAAGRYKDATPSERAIALSLAQQIDRRTEIARQLDDEIESARELGRVYEQQESRLRTLVAGTDIGQNVQRMQDEALAESALLAGKIDTSTYDQIIAKLHEVKDEGKDAFAELQQAIEGWGRNAADAFVEFAFTGKASFSDMVKSMLKDLAKMAVYQNVMSPIFSAVSGALSGLFNPTTTTGGTGTFNGITIKKLAKGGVVSGAPDLHHYVNTVQTTPKLFGFDRLHAFARGGVFAESGPEAVMPLARDSQGRLGVRSQGGSTTNISINVDATTGQADSRTDNPASAWNQMADRFKSMIVNEITVQKRPGGLLYGA